MAFNPDKYLSAAREPVVSILVNALVAAYNDGVSDAVEALGAADLAYTTDATTLPVATSTGGLMGWKIRRKFGPGERAPRGTISSVIGKMMVRSPGLTARQYERMAAEYDDRISPRSIGNELRRLDGKKYQRVRFNWWPIDELNYDPVSNPKAP